MGRKSFALKLHKVFFPPTPAVKFYSSKRYLMLSACYALSNLTPTKDHRSSRKLQPFLSTGLYTKSRRQPSLPRIIRYRLRTSRNCKEFRNTASIANAMDWLR